MFGAYEGLRTIQGQPFLGSVPSQAFLSGDFSALATQIRDPLTGQPFPGNVIPRARFSKFANTLTPTIPAPNTAGANNYTVIRNFVDDANTATVRADQTLNNNHSLFQRFMYYKGSQLQPAAFTSTDLPQRGRNLAIGHTWVLASSLVNEFRFGYNYAYHLNAPISPDGRNWTADLGLQNLSAATFPLAYGRPNVTMAGFTAQGEGGNTQGATENIYSVSNATSKTFGGHTLRFGVQAQFRKFEHLTDNSTRGNFTFNGKFTGNSVADYLLGYCSTCAGAFGASGATYHSPTIAPFIDDNWQPTANLSLQLGLRWEYLAPWAEQNGVEAAFDAATGKIGYNALPTTMPAALVPLVHQQEGYFPDGILQKDLNNFGPRIGVAYNLNRPYGPALGVRRLLRQPEPERAAIHPADSAVLRAVLVEPAPDGSAAGRHAFSRSEQHPAVSCAVLTGSGESHAIHDAMERELPAEPRAGLPVRSGIHGKPQQKPEQAVQHQPGRFRHDAESIRGCRFRSSSPQYCTRRPSERQTSRVCRCASRSATPRVCSSSRTTNCRRIATTVPARSKRMTPRSGPTSTRTRASRVTTSGIVERSASATSCRSATAGTG